MGVGLVGASQRCVIQADQATHGDDRVGEVEEGGDCDFSSFIAAL
jgi:hypothetical protein